MPDFSITIDDIELKNILKGLDGDNLRQALEDAGQIIMESTKAGYLREKGPDGTKWNDNPSWYKVMKRNAATLTGPTSKALGGVLAGKYEFAQINLKRMKNSLIKDVNTAQKKVTIQYDSDARDRAQVTQLGGEGRLILNSVGGGGTIEMSVNVQARPHLGVAENWQRLGFKTDVQHILEAFEGMVDKHLE